MTITRRTALVAGLALAVGTSGSFASAQTPSVVAIGFTGPLSGGAASYGADVQRGIQMAIDEINGAGGVTIAGKKTTFKLVSLDDQYRPNEAATNAKRLAQQENAPIVFCPHSGGILAIEGFNDKQSPKFVLGAYTSEPAILKVGDSMMVMEPPAYDEYFKPFTETEMKRFGKKLALLGTTTAYGNNWAKGFAEAWKAAGGTVLGNNGVDYNTTTDFAGAVSKTLAEKPDVILVGGPSQPTALVMKAARDQGFTGGFAMMDQAKFDQVTQVLPVEKLDGTIGVLPFKDYASPGLKPFLDAYTKKYGTEKAPNNEVAINYMTMHVFAQAMALAGSTDPAAIMAKVHDAAQKLPATKQPIPIRGVAKSGHLIVDGLIAVVEKGQYRRMTVQFTE